MPAEFVLKGTFDHRTESERSSKEFPVLKSMVLAVAGLLLVMDGKGNEAESVSETVRIDTGTIRGAGQNGVLVFKGIPYAASPEGMLRWRPPQPPAAWDGVRDATRFGPACIQPVPESVRKSVRMSEDCLTLNVWTPAKSAAEKLPVMVWIHGGGFRGGTGSNSVFDGTALATQGAVIVTLNYRLGPFGLFAHSANQAKSGEPVANYYLMDQIAALEWVRRNIGSFGGDKNSVTVFGESSGGTSVLALMVSSLNRNLFHRAIVQSGRLANRTLSEARTQYDTLIKASGLDQTGDVMARLRTAPAQDLLDKFVAADFTPVVDGVLLPEAPLKAFRAGRQAPVPLLIGVTSDEGSLLGPSGQTPDSVLALVKADEKELDALYPGLPARSDGRARAVYDDLFYGAPARLLARLVHLSGHPAYLYEFAYIPDQLRDGLSAAPHGLDVPFIFRNKHPKVPLSDLDMRMAVTISDFWLRFARQGDPNVPGTSRWPKYDEKTDRWMVFENDGPTVRIRPRSARLDLCEQFIRIE